MDSEKKPAVEHRRGSGCISLADDGREGGGTLRRYAVLESVSRKVRRPAGAMYGRATEISGCACEIMAAFNGVTHLVITGTARHGTTRLGSARRGATGVSRLSKRIRAHAPLVRESKDRHPGTGRSPAEPDCPQL